MNRIIYFGPPGTGKTTKLLRLLEQELEAKVPIERIAFLTFTRRARREAVERVEQVLGIKAKELPHFRTIHSMAFRALNLKDGDVLTKKNLQEFGAGMGLVFGDAGIGELAAEGLTSQSQGDQMLALENLARLRGEKLHKTWGNARTGIEWPTLEHFAKSYAKFKKEKALLDFTDVLTEFAKQRITIDVDVAFIDEAQDLSALQWYAALQAVESAKRQYVAGDDDQAIYRWAGAEVKIFMELPGERQVLNKSYRLPVSVHGLAQSIINRVKTRVLKRFSARDAPGHIHQHANVESLPVGKDDSKWLYLVRNRYLLQPLRQYLEHRGIVYSQHGMTSIVESERNAIYDWEKLRAGQAVPVHRIRDVYGHLKTKTQIVRGHKLLPGIEEDAKLMMVELAEYHGLLAQGTWFEVFQDIPDWRRAYYRALLRMHGTLKLPAQVQLETIHGAKGAEAPNVALFLEQSRRVWDEAQHNPDDEHRVWYVGATRAREQLHLVNAGNRWGYLMPRTGTNEKPLVSA
jgi:DNA helicase II / ATP-dependent DNA helicase PcrA